MSAQVKLIRYKFFHNAAGVVAKAVKDAQKGCYVLVPSSGDVRMLEKALSSDPSLMGKKRMIMRWEELYREAASQLGTPKSKLRRQIDPPDHWLVVHFVLKNLIREAESINVNVPPSFKQRGFVELLGKTLRELLREEVLPEHLWRLNDCERCEKGKCLSLGTESKRLLCRLYHDYVQYLEESSLMDSAQTATAVRHLLEDAPLSAQRWLWGQTFVFVGFLSFTHGQLLLVRSLKDLGANIVVLTPNTGLDIHDAQEQLRTITDELAELKEEDSPQIVEAVLGDYRLELELLARYLVLWRKGYGPLHELSHMPFPGWGRIGIMVEQQRLPTLKEAFDRYGIPYFLENGPSVASTLLWQGARKAWEIAKNDFPTEETAWLLASSYMAAKDFPLEKALEKAPKGLEGWRSFLSSNAPSCLKHLDRIVSFTQKIERGGTPSELYEALLNLAGKAERTSQWGKALSWEIQDLTELDEDARQTNQAIKELEEKALQIKEAEPDIGPAGEEPLRKEDAMAFLAAWAERSNLWRGVKIKGSISVYTATPPVLTYHDVWILTGADSSSWPGNLRQGPLLTDEERETLHDDPSLALGAFHLPLLPEIRQQRHALLRRLMCCGTNLSIVSRPLQDDAGRPLRRSPFLEKALEGNTPWAKRIHDSPLTRGLKDVIPPDDDFRIKPLEVREKDTPLVPKRFNLLRKKDLPTARFTEKIEKAHLSDLDVWNDCPFRYMASRHLKIEEPVIGLFDTKRAGIFIHSLWENAWKRKLTTSMPLEEIVENIWDQELGKHYPALLDPKGPLNRHNKRLKFQAKRLCKLQETLDEQLKLSRKNLLTEKELSINVEGCLFRGRCDRVDVVEDGVFIYDYKLGSSPNYSKALQLASYALAWEQEEPSMPVNGVIYLCMGDGGFVMASRSENEKAPGKKFRSLSEQKERALEKLEEWAKTLKEGNFPPNYNSDTCKVCGYRGLCRREETPSGGTEEDE